MNAATASNESVSITIWKVNHDGNEVRCDVETPRHSDSLFRGTVRLLVDGTPSDSRLFTTVDELMALTADWHQSLALAVGAWQ